MSLGRQPPPKPTPALRNLRPIRVSWPRASARSTTSAPATSQTSATALMKEILVARNALAATLTSSAVGEVGDDQGRVLGQHLGVDLAQGALDRRLASHRRPAGRGAGCPGRRSPRAGTPGSSPAARADVASSARICRRAAPRCPRARWTCPPPGRRRAGAGPATGQPLDLAQVGTEAAGLLRRPDAQEVHVAEGAGLLVGVGEPQRAGLDVPAEQLLEVGLVERRAAPATLAQLVGGRPRRRGPRSPAPPSLPRESSRGTRSR